MSAAHQVLGSECKHDEDAQEEQVFLGRRVDPPAEEFHGRHHTEPECE